MKNDLINNLDKVHTTELGVIRIKKNLNLDVDDVVAWCKQKIKDAERITRQGKNWYVFVESNIITVNAHSFTVITAHKDKKTFTTRPILPEDYSLLEEFLYLAIHLPFGTSPPPREIIFDPNIFIYIKDFGGEDDCGVVAELAGEVVGAAWTRIIPAYGHLDDDTPELAISISPSERGKGIGTKMMKALFKLLKEKGYHQTSLSVQKDNPAAKFYERLGYTIIDNNEGGSKDDYLMVKVL